MTPGGLPALLKKTAADANRLVRLEVQLVAERIKAQSRRKAVLAGGVAGGALLMLFGMLFLLAAAAAGLALVVAWWLALLIVGGGLLVLGVAIAGLSAVGLGRGGVVPEEAKSQLKEDVRWARERSR